MQPEQSISQIARKELTLFFASPIAYLFLAAFVAITLFVFFWGEAFFARNIADVRPIFQWMPVLLIFLSAALTMRMWSEERRSGTLEFVLTLPVTPLRFVLGKFIACVVLLKIAVALTLPLPLTVAWLGNLDWGPVVAGYIATVLLGSAYIAIGLFVSARSDNQIVSLMLTVLIGGLFYLIGSPLLTGMLDHGSAELLRQLGSGSRFEAITRGVLDLRDLYYYLSLIIVFLGLNLFALEKQRWASDGDLRYHRRWRQLTLLIIANALLANVWLAPLNQLRLDVTEGRIYSISPATKHYLQQLQEPLLIRGYFSAKTHPLLSPLVPQLQDLLREYEAAGDGRVRVEILDPVTDPAAEEEAGSKYGIKPMPFSMADRYQTALVNAYFHVLVKYGEEYQVLSFRDLIEVRARSENDIDIKLRNPEYDLTRAIKRTLYAYQSGGNLFDSIDGEVTFSAYVSPDSQLPEKLAAYRETISKVLDEQKAKAGDKLKVEFSDPQANGGALAGVLAEQYGLKPMQASLLDPRTFYFYLLLEHGDMTVALPLPEEFSEEAFKRDFDAGLKRFATGFVKTVGLVAPENNPYAAQMGMPPGGKSYNQLQQLLGQNVTVRPYDLKNGQVPAEVDLLMVVAPENLDDKQRFAIDQFLMGGGTVVMNTAPFISEFTERSLNAKAVTSGLDEWLAGYGLSFEKSLVMDPQNANFAVPISREVAGYQVQEVAMLDYPFFVDVRFDDDAHAMVAGLPQVTVPWASPITINSEKNKARTVTELLRSSSRSWLGDGSDIMPQMTASGLSPYLPQGEQASQLLAVMVEGRFDSFYAGKPSPLLASAEENGEPKAEDANGGEEDAQAKADRITAVAERSPDSARLILIASNDFASDEILGMLSSVDGSQYSAPLQLLANAVDWSLEDRELLAIRGRGHFNRTLPPLADSERQGWEYFNYALAVLAVGLVYAGRNLRRRQLIARQRQALALQGGE